MKNKDPIFALFDAAKSGHYPPGTTAKMLAEIPSFVDPRIARTGFMTTILHIAAEFGHLPEDTTLQILAKAVDDLEETAMEVAIKTEHLSTTIDAPALAGFKMDAGDTALHRCALIGKYPLGTTLGHLISAVDQDNWTALHTAARCLNLLPDTTIKDLLGPKATIQPTDTPPSLETPLDALLFALQEEPGPPSLACAVTIKRTLLASTKLTELNVESAQQLKEAGVVLSKICPVETALWMGKEYQKLQNIRKT